jgi:hypothetical protein
MVIDLVLLLTIWVGRGWAAPVSSSSVFPSGIVLRSVDSEPGHS